MWYRSMEELIGSYCSGPQKAWRLWVTPGYIVKKVDIKLYAEI
jgi:hypothetical protein